MSPLGPIQIDEDVGHDMTRSSESKARNADAIYDSMHQNINDSLEISVNRVSLAEKRGEIDNLVNIILQRGTSGKRRFQGWGMLSVKTLSDTGITVIADPAPPIGNMPENPYHALVILPEPTRHDPETRDQYLRLLAELAAQNWKPRPR